MSRITGLGVAVGSAIYRPFQTLTGLSPKTSMWCLFGTAAALSAAELALTISPWTPANAAILAWYVAYVGRVLARVADASNDMSDTINITSSDRFVVSVIVVLNLASVVAAATSPTGTSWLNAAASTIEIGAVAAALDVTGGRRSIVAVALDRLVGALHTLSAPAPATVDARN